MPWINKTKTVYGEVGKPIRDTGICKLPQNLSILKEHPDLFEFVAERGDRTILNNFIVETMKLADRVGSSRSEFLVGRLLGSDAIKPEFLEKLRRGE